MVSLLRIILEGVVIAAFMMMLYVLFMTFYALTGG